MAKRKRQDGKELANALLHPQAMRSLITDWEGAQYIICPVCGNEDDIDGFDCLGADEDCVFCNQCNTELSL